MHKTIAPTSPLFPLFMQLCQLHGELPFSPLTLAQRRELGGFLLPHGPGIVHAVGAGLAAQPALFPDVRETGAALLGAQREAYLWLAIRDGLSSMAALAADSYLRAQATLNKRALEIIRQVKDGPAPTEAGPQEIGERNLALLPAYLLVHTYYKGLEKRKAKQKAKRQQLRQATMVLTVDAPAAPPSAQASAARLRTARIEREERAAALQAVFTSALKTELRDLPYEPPRPIPIPVVLHLPDRSKKPLTRSPEAILAALSPEEKQALRRLLADQRFG